MSWMTRSIASCLVRTLRKLDFSFRSRPFADGNQAIAEDHQGTTKNCDTLMSFWVRKIDKGKWLENDIMNGQDVSADAITRCMKTTDNKLSVWEIVDESEMNDVAVALSFVQEHLETIDVVPLEIDRMKTGGIEWEDVDGVTKLPHMVKRHRNLVGLSYKTLGTIIMFQVQLDRN